MAACPSATLRQQPGNGGAQFRDARTAARRGRQHLREGGRPLGQRSFGRRNATGKLAKDSEKVVRL